MRVEFVALPQEMSAVPAECSGGDCERESLSFPEDSSSIVKAVSDFPRRQIHYR